MQVDKIIKETAEELGISNMVAEKCYQVQWRFVGNEINGSHGENIKSIFIPSFGIFWVKKFNLLRVRSDKQRLIRNVIEKRNRELLRGEYTLSIKSDSVDVPK